MLVGDNLYEFDQPAFFPLENISKYHQYLVCGGQLSILSIYRGPWSVLCSMGIDCVLMPTSIHRKAHLGHKQSQIRKSKRGAPTYTHFHGSLPTVFQTTLKQSHFSAREGTMKKSGLM